ncbi:hypothetical protein CYL16_06880 [Mycobacterium sp. EPG1]|nr:hypothetical protein CYL16_06880 [Mycobacterium sp. EPG1]
MFRAPNRQTKWRRWFISLRMFQVHDDAGLPLASTFDTEDSDDHLAVILHSAGGKSNAGGVSRNRDYPLGLKVILQRLGALEGVLLDAYVDSSRVQSLPIEKRRLIAPAWNYPLHLSEVADFDGLRLDLTERRRRSANRQQQRQAVMNASVFD